MKMTRSFWNFTLIEMKSKGVELPTVFGKDGYKLPEEVYGKPIYITDAERDLIFKANLEDERLKWVRDVFIFQCHVGARIGDLLKFTKSNVNDVSLSYIARKTKDKKPVTISIPLTEVAKEIISRYDLPDGRLLPFRSSIKYNEYLKELFEKVELTRIVTRPNPTTREPENVRICDIAISHMARRTFIGNKYGKVSDGVLVSMTGHVNDSRALSRYYDVSDDLKRKALGIQDIE
jgi:integrase